MKNFFTILFILLSLSISELYSQVLNDNINYGKQMITGDPLPADFPAIKVDILNNPAPGYFLISASSGKGASSSLANYLVILDSAGNVINYKRIGISGDKIPRTFQQISNGLLVCTIESSSNETAYIMDESLNTLDSFPNYNSGYLDILPNGHYLLRNRANISADLSNVFKNGEPNATIIENTTYELDKDKNPVFVWRTMDYYPLSASYSDSLVSRFDFCHTNMTYPDYDGNYLFSNRNLSTITKVDRKTGNIIWKLGGKENQFTFIGENASNSPNYFSFQHHVRRNLNGNITLFDNGLQHNPQYSRGVEYKIDEVNKTAEMLWEFRQTPDVFAKNVGSVQTLPNGNKIIGWGEASTKSGPITTELNPENTIVCQLSLPKGFNSMMSTKSPLNSKVANASITSIIEEGNTYNFNNNELNTCVIIKVNKLEILGSPSVTVKEFEFASLNPDFVENPAPMVFPKRIVITKNNIDSIYAEIRFNANCLGIKYKPEEHKVYLRDNEGSGVFKQIPTIYNAQTNEYIVNSSVLGEFIFAIPEKETKPGIAILISPKNNEKVNISNPVLLNWIPRGYFTKSQIQIALDENFSNIIVDTTLLGSLSLSFNKCNLNSKYYWKVRSINVNTVSDFSEVRLFVASEPFISIAIPNGGEVWEKDGTNKIIRWDKNIDDLVKIELLKNNASILVIKDSLVCPTGAFGWNIPESVIPDSNYKIRVTSIKDKLLTTISESNFTIKNGVSVNENLSENIIFSVSPNPAADYVEINVRANDNLSLQGILIYNTLGECVLNLGVQYLEPKQRIEISSLPAGMYFVRIGNSCLKFIKI